MWKAWNKDIQSKKERNRIPIEYIRNTVEGKEEWCGVETWRSVEHQTSTLTGPTIYIFNIDFCTPELKIYQNEDNFSFIVILIIPVRSNFQVKETRLLSQDVTAQFTESWLLLSGWLTLLQGQDMHNFKPALGAERGSCNGARSKGSREVWVLLTPLIVQKL